VSVSRAAAPDEFVHPALFYDNTADYLDGTVPYIEAGLAAGEPVMVAVPGENLEHIRGALGRDAARVELHDMTVAGRNPGRIIPGVLLAFAAAHPADRVRIIGEPIWAGRTETEYPACAQHEALINAAFAGRPATILCPYDVRRLDPGWVRDAYRTHPVVRTTDGTARSPAYGDPAVVAGSFNQPLPAPPAGCATVPVRDGNLGEVRRFVADHAVAAGLAAGRVAELTVAVNELASNTVRHTGGDGTVAVWSDADRLVCQVTDSGHIGDPLAGRIPASVRQLGGRGLVLVNQLCDFVRVHTRPGATAIRIEMVRN
jgi:anti-sigma regulatory factor (Ser/Thr protein kinase)